MTGQQPDRLKERLEASRLRLLGCRIIMYIITIMAALVCASFLSALKKIK